MKKILSYLIFFSGICNAQYFSELNDQFENGLNNWIITNEGGTCVWENYFPPYPSPYTLPTIQNGVMAADANNCGVPISTTATLDTIIDMSGYQCLLWIEWDNDWNATNNNDTALVEISSDFGESWTSLWAQVGNSTRNTHEYCSYDEYSLNDVEYAIIRFRTVQQGNGSWWAVDNFTISLDYILVLPQTPTNLSAELTGVNPDALLSWEFNSIPFHELGFQITRKLGAPWIYTNYEILDSVDLSIRTYIDTSVEISNHYSYRIRSYSDEFISFFSDPAEIDIVTSVENPAGLSDSKEYYLGQNYPNPFNPSTKIKFSVPENVFLSEAKNLVTLKVYDVLGNEVATLVNKDLFTGEYEVDFDGIGLPSGVYFYQLKSGRYIDTKKMILIK